MHLDLVAWTTLQEQFSTNLGLAIDFFDINLSPLVCTGKRTNYANLIRSQKMGCDLITQCNNEHLEEVRIAKKPITYTGFGSQEKLMVPVFNEHELIGILVTEFAIKLDSSKIDELTFLTGGDKSEIRSTFHESTPKISIDECKRALSTIASIAPKIAFEKQEITSELSKLTLIKDFTQSIRGILDLTQLTSSIERFFESFIKSSSTTLVTYKNEEITNLFHSEVQFSKSLLNLDIALAKIASQTKTGEYIPDSANDLRLREHFEKPKGIVSIPLVQQKEILGCVIIHGDYLKALVDEDFEVLSLVSDYLAVSVSNSLSLKEVERLSITDGLTGLNNRRSFNINLAKEIERAKRSGEPLSLLLFDIDNFKNYNDSNGHQAGDKLLQELSNLLKREIRSTDICARYGGEEFVVILPETSVIGSEQVAEKLRQVIEDHPFDFAHKQPLGCISVSIGLSTLRPADTQETLLKRADDYLYQAKDAGRNRWISSKTAKHEL